MSASSPSRSGLRYQLRLFFTALQFFTRLPAPRWTGFSPDWLADAMRYFPAIGIVVSLVCMGVYWVVASVLPQLVAVPLTIAAGVYLTGVFHEDGFADVCDGFGGGLPPSRVLEIMRDPGVGAYGTVGIVLLLLIKTASLASLPAGQVIPALFVAHPLSRCMAAALMWRMDYAREEGKAKFLVRRLSTKEFFLGVATALIPIAICFALNWLTLRALLFAVLSGLAAALFLAYKFFRRIRGYTGDCLGAVQQLSEVTIYLGLLIAASPTLPS